MLRTLQLLIVNVNNLQKFGQSGKYLHSFIRLTQIYLDDNLKIVVLYKEQEE